MTHYKRIPISFRMLNQIAVVAGAQPGLWPFAVLLVGLVFVIVSITVLRVHAFLALILAALLVGLMAEKLPDARPRSAPPGTTLTAADGKPLKNHWLQAVELTTAEFGKTAGAIGLVIGCASIISMCLMESGAADKVVRRFLAVFGENRAGVAVLVSTYLLSVPIFFDTMFMLMVPLAMALRLRTGKDYTLYVLAICCGGVITHSLTVPHPGPLAMVENLKIDVGFSILAGVVAGVVPAVGGWYVAKWINARSPIPLRETPGISLNDLKGIVSKPESELPSLLFSITPVVLPILLIGMASSFEVIRRSAAAGGWAAGVVGAFGGQASFNGVVQYVEFIGNKNIALLVGAFVSILLLVRQKKLSMAKVEEMIGPPLLTAGVIILITSAGGAFGLMLKNAGVGDAIKALTEGKSVNLILLSWLVALVIRIAQGSATVAMLTTSAMVYPMMTGIAFNPIYIFLSIGFGAFGCSWMNDSGFWVVSRLSGFTEKETLRTWTVLLTAVSVIGLLVTLTLATVLPLASRVGH